MQTGRTPTEVRLRLGVMCGALAVVVYALTQAVTLPLLPTLLLVCSFGPMLAIGSAGLWELLGLHRRTATLDLGLVANLAAGVAVTLMLLAQLGLKAWFDTGLGGSAQQVSPEVAQAAFQASNGLQLGLDGLGPVPGHRHRHAGLEHGPASPLRLGLCGDRAAGSGGAPRVEPGRLPGEPRAGWLDRCGPAGRWVVPVGHAADGDLDALGPGPPPGIRAALSARSHDHAALRSAAGLSGPARAGVSGSPAGDAQQWQQSGGVAGIAAQGGSDLAVPVNAHDHDCEVPRAGHVRGRSPGRTRQTYQRFTRRSQPGTWCQ